MKKAGFTCIATAELLEKRLNIQKLNNKCKYETGYIHGSLTDQSIHAQLYQEIEFFKQKEKVKNVDLVIATPPCQGMSVANHKKGEELGRNSLVVESIRIVKNITPKYFIFENVRAFLTSICTDIDGQDKAILEAISNNLAALYSIESKVINLKNYGANSSRTRTVVLGVRKDLKEITPLDLLPDFEKEKNLRQLIGHLPSLTEMGQFDADDIYHSFRPYKEHMLPWITSTPYGQSAFDNISDKLKPHQIGDNGEIVVNQNKNGDKYQRQLWDKVAPCIHTRSDCLPSQNTVHPVDNRVFSIRELMLMMSIPSDFKWISDELTPDKSITDNQKWSILKKFDVNIRQCIGEAVPTQFFTNIANKINYVESQHVSNKPYIESLIKEYNLAEPNNLLNFIKENSNNYSRVDMLRICELANSKRLNTAAFYTRQDICFSVVESLPKIKKDTVRILEPSVGVGNFLYLLSKKYQDKNVIIDCVDINEESIKLCQILSDKYLPANVTINFIHDDFLLNEEVLKYRYDIVIGNPPYMKLSHKEHELEKYKFNAENKKTNNIFSFFIEKSLKIADHVALIVPKTLLNAPEYEVTRSLLSKFKIERINDYNEKAFDVKIETISFVVKTKPSNSNDNVEIYSYLLKKRFSKNQNYITNSTFDSWLLYRDDYFDNICDSLEFGIFKVFRDRQLTKSNTTLEGEFRVIKSRNIGNGEIIDIDGYDRYVDSLSGLAVSKFINTSAILVPNLTYNPRAARLPDNHITDGSAAILYTDRIINDHDIDYFSSDEFNKFYRIARNYGTRSMNIDSVSVNYFGLKNKL